MDLYNQIKQLNEEEIKRLIDSIIQRLTIKSRVQKKRFIGIDCNVGPDFNFYGIDDHDSQSIWQGFIPNDVKLVYKYCQNAEGYTFNDGGFYYIDSNDYLYEFAMYIQKQNITDNIQFFYHVFNFVNDYFNNLSQDEIDRNKMYAPLVDARGRRIESLHHDLSAFKDKNNAKCTEYSAMAQNILSVFGYQVVYLIGSISSRYDEGAHAFNLVSTEKGTAILDLSHCVYQFDYNSEIVGALPFIGIINDYSYDDFREHYEAALPYTFPEYNQYKFAHEVYISDGTREYVIGNTNYYSPENNQEYQKKLKVH